MITAGGMLRCAERELGLRRRVYPQWVASSRMSQANADREIEMMEAIVEHLRAEAGAWSPLHADGEGAPAVPANVPAVLVSFYGLASGDQRRPLVAVVESGQPLPANTYAWTTCPPPAELPPEPPAQPSLL